MPEKKEIGALIPAYLKDHNITAVQFAKEIEASKASIYNWIAGKPMIDVYYNKLLSILREYI